MKILSQAKIELIGTNPRAFPMPDLLPGVYGGVGAGYLLVLNLGVSACMLAVTPTPSPSSAEGGTLVPVAVFGGIPGATHSGGGESFFGEADTTPNPYTAIPITGGGGWWAAVTVPVLIGQATATATAGSGASSLTVDVATGIVVGQSVGGPGIQAGTLVTSVSGLTIGISLPTIAALNNYVEFSSAPSPLPPGLLAVALAGND